MTIKQVNRESGGRIDRNRPLEFTFNGKTYSGYQGDTLASALIANGVMMTARSFRYHRPRGIFSAGIEECHALVSVGEGHQREPNVRATRILLYGGLVANSQGGRPSLKWDLAATFGWLSRFFPPAFYYKTFLWPHWKWYEGFIRRMAGQAPAPELTPDQASKLALAGSEQERYEKRHAHCELLIVGGGHTGLAAALAAAESGNKIILADDQTEFGGCLLWNRKQVNEADGIDWVLQVINQLSEMENVTLLLRTTVVAAWDHGYFTAIQHGEQADINVPTLRLWKIRSQKTLLATGAIERPLIFPNNDRPGIMLAASARQYINRYAARPGKRAVIYTNNDSAYHAALDLHASGTTVVAIVDLRVELHGKLHGELQRQVREQGIKIHQGYEIAGTRGYFRINQLTVRPGKNNTDKKNTDGASSHIRLDCDLLCTSGGWNPTLHLLSQAGGKLKYDEKLCCFLPREQQPGPARNVQAAGSANGCFYPALNIKPHWQTAPPYKGRQWVDFLHDVTTHSIEIAAREGFTSVEHLKRYTTTGMAIDQGKTANVNALAILGEASNRPIAEVGTTTFRPPFHPVALAALVGRETGSRAWPIRLLPLHDWHVASGGEMEDHSGWQRAACYPRDGETEQQAILREVLAARQGVTLFDSSSLGKLEVKGPDAGRFLNRMLINNAETLKTGRVRYGMMLNENGVIIDDGVFARLEEDFFLVSASSAGTAKIAIAFEEWLQTEWPELDVLVHNATTQWATLTVGGPKSPAVIGALLSEVNISPENFSHMSVLEGVLDELPYRLMRVSFTGEITFELSVPARYALAVWQQLLGLGESLDITPLGMEALDVLRTEKGFLEVGVDTDVSTSPLDVGWAVPISRKSRDFIGKRSLARPNDKRADRLQLVGLKPEDMQQFVPVGSHIVNRISSGNPEGHVTSSCISPTLGYSIAMAMLKSGHSRMGETILLDVDSEPFEAEVVPLGFYDPGGKRL